MLAFGRLDRLAIRVGDQIQIAVFHRQQVSLHTQQDRLELALVVLPIARY